MPATTAYIQSSVNINLLTRERKRTEPNRTEPNPNRLFENSVEPTFWKFSRTESN